MKATTRKIITVLASLVLLSSSLSASVVFSGTTGIGRFFEMATGHGAEGGFDVDGLQAGVNALVDLEGNTFTVQAVAQKAADADLSVMTFSASFYRDADLSDSVSLFMETGVESHLILTDSVSTEVGLAMKGGLTVAATDSLSVSVSAGITDMLFSTSVSTIYGSASGSVSMVGVNAQVGCSYSFS